MSLPLYRVWHDRPNCIACGACAAAAPENWVMNEEDGLADCISTSISESEREANEEAALLCPVSIIHIAKEGEVPQYFKEKGIRVPPSGKRED